MSAEPNFCVDLFLAEFCIKDFSGYIYRDSSANCLRARYETNGIRRREIIIDPNLVGLSKTHKFGEFEISLCRVKYRAVSNVDPKVSLTGWSAASYSALNISTMLVSCSLFRVARSRIPRCASKTIGQSAYVAAIGGRKFRRIYLCMC